MRRDASAARSRSSLLGPLRLVAADGALIGVYLPSHHCPWALPEEERPHEPVLREAANQLGEYFRGLRRQFELPLRLEGTPFQKAAWQALLEIPFGQTRSYREQARALGRPSATRAVGAANGRNPFTIIVPCHRVVGSDGHLTGYTGGLSVKRWLLQHEAHIIGATLFGAVGLETAAGQGPPTLS
ncbi:MAG: methylated-DNA--[protein]-cysteine S-methyltransferase [Candidatus Wallbacteria bacterium]|nr:methylated-DNA--[protein]-cysteine S-methyltransferase [Candidatus Wallbacteria bacterium]